MQGQWEIHFWGGGGGGEEPLFRTLPQPISKRVWVRLDREVGVQYSLRGVLATDKVRPRRARVGQGPGRFPAENDKIRG